MAAPREIQLHVLNETGLDLQVVSETLPSGHLLMKIRRRVEQRPSGVILPHETGPVGFGVLQYEEGKKPPIVEEK